ncbi:hypothetical protein DFJ58DRAFT_849975 [Suillus subalutaceus]|uniref:uncharacterized protein n=1 Tax=Suillus subalutaceus TaxID=48586 RepID=UPI001B86324D|nr:uncharacterized protein DFJ58DRAFT_849975 [Suillus subalutaceus]KAG1821442.1 hypothetical protein DFJ58DRAFT_849975 [Suillus subalutaceus]
MPVGVHFDNHCWLVSQRYVVDGNFTAQHMTMKKPQWDISLSDGLGYMVKEREYQTHLSLAVESKERSSCSNHRAVNAANISRSNLRATGVGATACARHGCFVPHSIVNFQKGERYSLNFIQGAGQVDGEILETLWAPFNKISPTARSMSQAHRQEVLDDHMCDSNWKKLVGIMKTLLKKYKRALKGVDETKTPFDELARSLDPEKILIWEINEQKAMEEHGEYLDIYQLQINKVWILDSQQYIPMILDSAMQIMMAMSGKRSSDGEISEDLDEEILAEEMGIWMPSSVAHNDALTLGLGPLQAEELELRKGQANDCLESLCMALGHKAIIYRQSKKLVDVNSKLTNKEVTEENRFGQGSDKLAWFWRVNNASRGQEDAWMDEFYRVNWLKAKARWSRWQEELSLVRHEMGWTINWFKYHEKEWDRRGGTKPLDLVIKPMLINSILSLFTLNYKAARCGVTQQREAKKARIHEMMLINPDQRRQKGDGSEPNRERSKYAKYGLITKRDTPRNWLDDGWMFLDDARWSALKREKRAKRARGNAARCVGK